jgi:hypothetical protein
MDGFNLDLPWSLDFTKYIEVVPGWPPYDESEFVLEQLFRGRIPVFSSEKEGVDRLSSEFEMLSMGFLGCSFEMAIVYCNHAGRSVMHILDALSAIKQKDFLELALAYIKLDDEELEELEDVSIPETDEEVVEMLRSEWIPSTRRLMSGAAWIPLTCRSTTEYI